MLSLYDQQRCMRERDDGDQFSGCFPKEVILMGVRWYGAYPLSIRHVEELMEERGVDVDHSTINRWTIK
jgi:transposase-like protein